MPKTQRIAVLSSVLIAVVLAAGFFTWFDRVPYQEFVGYHGEARSNTLFAAQRFLARVGIQAQSFASFEGLPPQQATLILPTPRASLSEARNRELLKWMREGGHLIAVTWTLKDEGTADPLLDLFGIEQEMNELEEGQYKKVLEVKGHVAEAPGFGEPLKVHFHPSYRFTTPPPESTHIVEDEFGPHLISLPVGRGRLTALTDYEFMENRFIGMNDHAALLWQLTRMTGDGPVWLVYAEDLPSLWRLIWEHARPVVWAAATLALWLIFAGSRRFGPVLPAASSARRSLTEHIIASGWFDWRQGHGETLLADMRGRVLRRLGRLDEREARAEWRHVAAATQLASEPVREALEPGAARDEARFTQAVRTLAMIGKPQ